MSFEMVRIVRGSIDAKGQKQPKTKRDYFIIEILKRLVKLKADIIRGG